MKASVSTLIRSLPFARAVVIAIRHFRSKRKISSLLKQGREICLELGAGQRKGFDEWITVDVSNSCDLYWDLRRGIPFPNGSVKKIYSSHFLEHLSFEQAQRMLDECKRALAPKGRFLICLPNARLFIEAYAKGATLDELKMYAPAYNHTTRIDYVNYIAYMNGEHRYMFDEENLLFILNAKGFKNVRLRSFDPKIDLKERDSDSIYAEAEI